MFGFAPTGDYSTRQLANTSLNHWAVNQTFPPSATEPSGNSIRAVSLVIGPSLVQPSAPAGERKKLDKKTIGIGN